MSLMLLALALAQAADGNAVAAAIAKTRTADRYAFKIETAILGGSSAQSTVAEGRYQKDQPAFLRSGELEVYRKGESMAVLKKDVWKKADGRDASRRLRGAFSVAGLRALRLPQEELAGLEKRFSAFRKLDAKEGDQDVYTAELTEEAAREMYDAHTERKAEVPPSGTGRFWITPAGELAMVEIIVRAKTKAKSNQDTGASLWITLSEVGTAKVEVPEAAAKALEEK
jgi:hypothetical protein